jgi:hypothetical protein
MGDPTSSYATAGIALRVSGALKPHHHDKVETPSVGINIHQLHEILLQNLIVLQFVKKFPEFYETGSFINAFTRMQNYILSLGS